METAPAASLPTRTCARNLRMAPAGDGGAPRVGGRARQPLVGSTDVRPSLASSRAVAGVRLTRGR
eukprot:15381590-Alexandrium_andersonii.AAC.1